MTYFFFLSQFYAPCVETARSLHPSCRRQPPLFRVMMKWWSLRWYVAFPCVLNSSWSLFFLNPCCQKKTYGLSLNLATLWSFLQDATANDVPSEFDGCQGYRHVPGDRQREGNSLRRWPGSQWDCGLRQEEQGDCPADNSAPRDAADPAATAESVKGEL